MGQKFSALIVDDEAELRRGLVELLDQGLNGYQFDCHEAENGIQALALVQSRHFDFVIMDVRMPEMDGLEALRQIKEFDSTTFVLIMTAHANVQDAVEAIKHGAYDYLEKPVNPEKLLKLLEKSIETKELVSELAVARPIFDEDTETEFIGSSQQMVEIYKLINKLSQVDTTVLIRGENGTGKELVARAIHLHSPRKDSKFVAVNCAAIPEELLESELFGHEKGAFTDATDRKIGLFQVASQGTIFLDEIAELRPELQVKLLRVLQNKTFIPVGSTREMRSTARVIAATNGNLEKMIEDGTFREDLFYRLNVMPIFMPPLRDRIDDLEGLVTFFIEKFTGKYNRTITGISAKALDILKTYSWPGNVRELENVIERTFIVETDSVIRPESLPEVVTAPNAGKRDASIIVQTSLDFDEFKEEAEKEFIIKALRSFQGRINKTVAHANIPKNTLLRKIKKYGINVKDYTHS